MNILRAKPSVRFPGLFGFDSIQCSEDEWKNAKWFFRIESESSDIEKDSGFNHLTAMQALVDISKEYTDDKLGKVYKVFLILGEGNAQSFGKDNQYSVIPVDHLKAFWLQLSEHNKLFKKIAFMSKNDIINANKLQLNEAESAS